MWDAISIAGDATTREQVSIRASRVGRDATTSTIAVENGVSIRASRVGRDLWLRKDTASNQSFQSARPVWDAIFGVNTTASEKEGFNPRVPCGTRWASKTASSRCRPFQSARPVWDAIALKRSRPIARRVSIRASRVGRDYKQLQTPK